MLRYIKTICTLPVLLLCMLPGSSVYAQNTDIDLLKDINQNRNKRWDGAMGAITQSVFPVAVGVPVAELIKGVAKHDKELMLHSAQTIAGLGLTVALSAGVKYGVGRSRPFDTYPGIDAYHYEATPSFPSMHTSVAFSVATSMSLGYRRWYVVVPAYGWAATAGYSRMHLGVHYPSDVLVGAVLGTGSAWLAYQGNKWLMKRHRPADVPLEE